MKISCKYDELVDPKQLKGYAKNRNIHTQDQIIRLAKLIDYQGQRAPIIVSNLSHTIVKGHGTRDAIIHNDWEKCAVVYQDFENEDQEYAFVQSDNAIAEWATLDLSGINIDLVDLGPEFDLDLLGIKNFTLDIAEKKMHASMLEKFGVPPFSVLNAREGYWQERKKYWISLGIQSEIGRGGGRT